MPTQRNGAGICLKDVWSLGSEGEKRYGQSWGGRQGLDHTELVETGIVKTDKAFSFYSKCMKSCCRFISK